MADTLFYAEVIPTVGAVAVLDGDEGFHAATVRRIRPGERLVLSDGRGVRADCIVEAADKRRISAKVLDRQTVPPASPQVTVVQAATHVILGAGHTHSSSSAMLAGHLLAGLVLAVVLRTGEARIFAAARRRYLQWQIAVRSAVAGLGAPHLPRPRVITGAAPVLTSWLHCDVQGRGPPAAAFC